MIPSRNDRPPITKTPQLKMLPENAAAHDDDDATQLKLQKTDQQQQ
jgi:hypothetical protein